MAGSGFVSTDYHQTQRERAGLLQRARAAQTPVEVARTRQVLRAWVAQHPGDVEVLLADEAMTRPLRWGGWDG